ncbi:MAG: preprotein translocase subunit SecE [Candidatus Syntrophosphaera sp.]|nr:preprotein translocase subunit SecE [Candidatus Syntrophosphaera sp.]
MKKLIEKISRFFHEVYIEMRSVAWPSKADVKEGTMVVIVISAIVGVFLSLVDYGFGQIVNLVF